MRGPKTISSEVRSRRDVLRAGLLGAGAWALSYSWTDRGTLSAADRNSPASADLRFGRSRTRQRRTTPSSAPPG